MKKDLTLLIMAGGMGSRFGGLKQVEPFGPNGEFIIDYSIYDAIKAGFNKVAFVIKEEHLDLFKETIGNRLEDKIQVEYVLQGLQDIPEGYQIPEDRVKPWGTAHATLVARNIVKEPFAVINADDFYGYDAYEKAANFLRNNDNQYKHAMVGYLMRNTLSENGSVKRGVVKTENGKLTKIIESEVEDKNGIMEAQPLDGSEKLNLSEEQLASMNLFCFMPSIFESFEKIFVDFLEENKNDLSKCESYITTTCEKCIDMGMFDMEILKTTSYWHGVTHKEDKEFVVEAINNYVKEGKYPNKLWE